MALYRHVGDKEQLISAVLDVYSQDLGALVLPQDQVERLRTIFTAIFEKLASERWIIELLQRGGRGGSGAVGLGRSGDGCVCRTRYVTSSRTVGLSSAVELHTRRIAQHLRHHYATGRQRVTSRGQDPRNRAEKLPVLSEVLEDWPGGTTTESYLEGLEVLISGYMNSD